MLTEKQYDRAVKALKKVLDHPDWFVIHQVNFAKWTVERLHEMGRRTDLNKAHWGSIRKIEAIIKKREASLDQVIS